MNKLDKPITIGYLGAHLKTYYAEEYNLFEESVRGLTDLGSELGFRVVSAKNPVLSAADVERELGELLAEDIDFLMVHHATFVMGDVIKQIARVIIPNITFIERSISFLLCLFVYVPTK